MYFVFLNFDLSFQAPRTSVSLAICPPGERWIVSDRIVSLAIGMSSGPGMCLHRIVFMSSFF